MSVLTKRRVSQNHEALFRWHLPVETICVIYLAVGKLPGEYPTASSRFHHLFDRNTKLSFFFLFFLLIYFGVEAFFLLLSSPFHYVDSVLSHMDPREFISSKRQCSWLSIFFSYTDTTVIIDRHGRTISCLIRYPPTFLFLRNCHFFPPLFFLLFIRANPCKWNGFDIDF